MSFFISYLTRTCSFTVNSVVRLLFVLFILKSTVQTCISFVIITNEYWNKWIILCYSLTYNSVRNLYCKSHHLELFIIRIWIVDQQEIRKTLNEWIKNFDFLFLKKNEYKCKYNKTGFDKTYLNASKRLNAHKMHHLLKWLQLKKWTYYDSINLLFTIKFLFHR